MATTGAFALVVLAACGSGGGESPSEPVTRVPTASDAAMEATTSAAASSPAAETTAATPEIVKESVAATPEAAGMATPERAGVATPATAAIEATPITAAQEATPMTAAEEATPVAGAEATPAGGTTGAASPEAAGASAEVVSVDIAFEPKALTIPANTDVKVSLPNQGAAAHNFSIDELGISVDLAPGATEEVTINAPAGTYQYYCNVPGHKEAGMVGTLTVE
ncbi:MAG: cupredoxin domain-containing protein [Thermomicrobiales bacterium]